MSIVHSSADSQTASRVRGGVESRPSAPQSPSVTLARGFATATGTLLSGISTPAVPMSSVMNSRKTTGSPSVTK